MKWKGIRGHWTVGIVAQDRNELKTFKYLSSLFTNKNSFQEEIKCPLKAGNSCYYSIQTLLSSRLLSKNLKIKLYKTIILPVVLYGCEAYSLTSREETGS